MNNDERIKHLEGLIKEMAMASGHVCSMMVTSEVMKSMPCGEKAKDLMTAIRKLADICSQQEVSELFMTHEGNGKT